MNMRKRLYRSGGLAVLMVIGIATAFMATAQAQAQTQAQTLGGFLEALSIEQHPAKGGCSIDKDGIQGCYGDDGGTLGWIDHTNAGDNKNLSIEGDVRLAEGGCFEDKNGTVRCYGEDGEMVGWIDHTNAGDNKNLPLGGGTKIAGISIEPSEPEPLCDTDPFSCFYLVNKDNTIPSGMRNTQQAFRE